MDDGYIIRGHRHSDAMQTAGNMGYGYIRQDMQCFVTSTGRFVRRKEGAALQNAAGIPSATTGLPINDILFSEDLYLRPGRTPWDECDPKPLSPVVTT